MLSGSHDEFFYTGVSSLSDKSVSHSVQFNRVTFFGKAQNKMLNQRDTCSFISSEFEKSQVSLDLPTFVSFSEFS